MPDNLYPVFDVPGASRDALDKTQYKPAPMFDFEAGDFIRDGANRVMMCDGREGYRQWCYKVLKTPKMRCLAYSDVGIEEESAMAQPTRQAVESAFERTITEALLKNPVTQRVKDFSFAWTGDMLSISFQVQAKNLAAFTIDLDVMRG